MIRFHPILDVLLMSWLQGKTPLPSSFLIKIKLKVVVKKSISGVLDFFFLINTLIQMPLKDYSDFLKLFSYKAIEVHYEQSFLKIVPQADIQAQWQTHTHLIDRQASTTKVHWDQTSSPISKQDTFRVDKPTHGTILFNLCNHSSLNNTNVACLWLYMNASSLCFCGKFISDSCTKNAPTYLIYLGDSCLKEGVCAKQSIKQWNAIPINL